MNNEVERLRAVLAKHANECWDADDTIAEDVIWSRPPGLLVSAIVNGMTSSGRALDILALAVAKRALACWELYCDGQTPNEAVAASEEAILGTGSMPDATLTIPAKPSFRGKRIVDCRECDTACAANAAARLVRFVRGRDPRDVVLCLGAAEGAFDQSPLRRLSEFQKWLIEVVLPAVVDGRRLSLE